MNWPAKMDKSIVARFINNIVNIRNVVITIRPEAYTLTLEVKI